MPIHNWVFFFFSSEFNFYRFVWTLIENFKRHWFVDEWKLILFSTDFLSMTRVDQKEISIKNHDKRPIDFYWVRIFNWHRDVRIWRIDSRSITISDFKKERCSARKIVSCLTNQSDRTVKSRNRFAFTYEFSRHDVRWVMIDHD